jgi:hypothetical protein
MPITCVLVGLALVPTLIHSYAGLTVTDGRGTVGIPSSLAGFTSSPSTRNANWGKRRFESDDWTERRYVAGSDEVLLTVIRSYDLKTLYHHPELAVAYGTSFVGEHVERLEQNPNIPVHVLQPGPGVRARAMYVLHYDDRFVENPITFQIRTAGELLFSGRKPMTLFFLHDLDVPEGASPGTLPSASLLFSAIDRFIAGSAASR